MINPTNASGPGRARRDGRGSQLGLGFRRGRCAHGAELGHAEGVWQRRTRSALEAGVGDELASALEATLEFVEVEAAHVVELDLGDVARRRRAGNERVLEGLLGEVLLSLGAEQERDELFARSALSVPSMIAAAVTISVPPGSPGANRWLTLATPGSSARAR